MSFPLRQISRGPQPCAIRSLESAECTDKSDRTLLAAAIAELRASEATLALIAAQMFENKPRDDLEMSMKKLRTLTESLDGQCPPQSQNPEPDELRTDCELSPREREVLRWITRGKTNAEIAIILGISRHTVDTHIRRTFGKLGTSDRTSAAIKAIEQGLLAD